jgi:prepilin-type processing-associated H-X9-DG protein
LTLRDPRDVVLAYEHATNHLRDGKPEGGNVLFADGHVEWHVAADLRAVIDWHAAGNGPMMWGKPTTSQPVRRPQSASAGTRGTAGVE